MAEKYDEADVINMKKLKDELEGYHLLNHTKERQAEEFRRMDFRIFAIIFQLKAITFDVFFLLLEIP